MLAGEYGRWSIGYSPMQAHTNLEQSLGFERRESVVLSEEGNAATQGPRTRIEALSCPNLPVAAEGEEKEKISLCVMHRAILGLLAMLK